MAAGVPHHFTALRHSIVPENGFCSLLPIYGIIFLQLLDTVEITHKLSKDVLHDPTLNKGTASASHVACRIACMRAHAAG